MAQFRPELETCPICNSTGNCHIHDYYRRSIIDFDAGQRIHGKAMPQLLTEFVDAIVEIASGKQTCNEKNDFRELAIFKSGVTL